MRGKRPPLVPPTYDGAPLLRQGTRLCFRVAADREERPPEGGEGPILWDKVFPEARGAGRSRSGRSGLEGGGQTGEACEVGTSDTWVRLDVEGNDL